MFREKETHTYKFTQMIGCYSTPVRLTNVNSSTLRKEKEN